MEALRQLLNSKDTSWMPADRDTSRSRISHTRTELSWESQPASASRASSCEECDIHAAAHAQRVYAAKPHRITP